MLTDAQKHQFEEENELDLSFGVKGLSRFRANIFMQRGAVAGAFRTIPFKILTFEELGLPPVVAELSKKPRGLVLVTGPTGSGKSTTLASIIDKINTERHEHIITIEDPIEYLHPHKSCVVNQREVGADTTSFKTALKYILRQDPDVVLIGEMRDLETIEAALVDRRDRPPRVRHAAHQLGGADHQPHHRRLPALPAAAGPRPAVVRARGRDVARRCCPSASGPGRVLALEVMVPNPAIRNLIREDKIHQIYSQMQVGQAEVRHADVQPVPGSPGAAAADHHGRGVRSQLLTRRSCATCWSSGGWRGAPPVTATRRDASQAACRRAMRWGDAFSHR